MTCESTIQLKGDAHDQKDGGDCRYSGGARFGGWLATLAIGAAAVAAMNAIGGPVAPMMAVIALSTTGLGTLLPILRDNGQLSTPFGQTVLAAGTLGEVGPIVASHRQPGAGNDPRRAR